MPQAPNLNGLPLWLQVAITICFGIVTLLVGLKGYLKRDPSGDEKSGTAQISQILGASLFDSVSMRDLTSACLQLRIAVDGLEESIREQTHFDRNRNELLQEIGQRLRELRERMDRAK